MKRLNMRILDETTKKALFYDDVAFFKNIAAREQFDPTDLLHMALKFSAKKIFSYALERKVNPRQKDIEGTSALYNALDLQSFAEDKIKNSFEMFKTLIKDYQCDPKEKRNGATLLHVAASEGLGDIIKFLLEENGFDVDEKSDNNSTPLFFAIRGEQCSTVRFLLEKGANSNAINNDQETPLWAAAYRKYPRKAIFEALMEYDADPSKLNLGKTLESYLASQGNWNGHSDMIKLLTKPNSQSSAASSSDPILPSAPAIIFSEVVGSNSANSLPKEPENKRRKLSNS